MILICHYPIEPHCPSMMTFNIRPSCGVLRLARNFRGRLSKGKVRLGKLGYWRAEDEEGLIQLSRMICSR